MSDEAIRTAPLSARWVRKMTVIIIILLAFGGWAMYDAVSVYPRRGERYADWAKWTYLDAASKANSEDFGIFQREASIPDPGEELVRLLSPEQRQRNEADSVSTTSPRRFRALMQKTRLQWLRALDRIGRLKPERTVIDNPRAELESLTDSWSSARSQPQPLAVYDIPSQWAIMGVCWAIAGVMIVRFVRVASLKYRWEQASMTLALPGGASITPDDLEEVDKRKWDKFIIFLKIKPGHPTLGGKEVRCDTYQHAELESWILAMEEKAFGPQEPAGAGSSTPSEPASLESADESL